MTPHLEVADQPTEADVATLLRELEGFNERQWPGHQAGQPLGVFLRDAQQCMVGGLFGVTYGGWLHVQYVWVSEALRGHGFGRRLIRAAEGHALARGCHSVWLDTFSFQAPEFYRGLGYEQFGELDWSADYKRLFFRRRIRPGAAPS